MPAIVTICAVFFGGAAAHGEERRYSIPELVREMSAGVVAIYGVDDQGHDVARGTGFVLDESGLIATAYHVLDGQRSARIETLDGESYVDIDLVNHDRVRDIAILKIHPSTPLKALALSPPDNTPAAGERVIAISHPLGYTHTVSEGLISAFRTLQGYKQVQVTTPVSRGSSGGPIFLLDGTVIGLIMSTSTAERQQNLNFATAIEYVRELVETRRPPEPLGRFMATMKMSRWSPAEVDAGPGTRGPIGPSFRVAHDHRRSLFDAHCTGEVVVAPLGFRFYADDGKHSFSVPWNLVQTFRAKDDWGDHAFHVRSDGRNFNFGLQNERLATSERQRILELAEAYRAATR